jgi:hypothetical protein
VEHRARELHFRHLALHTAEGAGHLVRWYSSRNYRFVEHVQWPGKTYRSVIMSKSLAAHAP